MSLEVYFEPKEKTINTAEGKNIYINDSDNFKIQSARFDGETSQATRSGKNLFNLTEQTTTLNGASYTAHNGKISVSNTCASNISSVIGTVTLEANTNYKVSYNKTGDLNSSYFYINDNGTYKYFADNGTLTVSQTGTYNVRLILVAATYSLTVKMQIEKGSSVTEWEQYGVMPSPDYPSIINNLEAKNYFDENQLLLATDWTKNGDGYYTGTYTDLYSKYKYSEGGFTFTRSFKPNTQYTISYTGYTSSGSGNARFIIYYTDGTNQNMTNLNYTTPTKILHTTTAGKTVSAIAFAYGSGASNVLYIKDIQVEEGIKATKYVPYNNLEVKVTNKNIFNKNVTALGSNVTKTVLDTGVRITTKTAGNYRYCGMELGKDELLGKSITISSTISASSTNKPSARLMFGTSSSPAIQGIGTSLTATGSNTLSVPSSFYGNTDRIYLVLYSNTDGTQTTDLYVDYTNLQVEIGTATTYEEHKEQVVYFPLEQGQKLYEGSYLAADGIHHTRTQLALDGTETGWAISGTEKEPYITISDAKSTDNTTPANALCSHFQVMQRTGLSDKHFAISANKAFIFYDSTYYNDLAGWKTWLSNNPITVEYELAEEEIIPYTESQQTAWNSIKNLHTYRPITNIYSDAYAHIGYIKYISDLIDEQYYTKLTNSFDLFNENFKLGTTPSNMYSLNLAKEGVETEPSKVLLKDNGNTFAELEVDNIEEQDYEYAYTLTDKMIDLDFYYDASEIFTNGSTTLYNIVMDICTKVGLTLGTTNFRGYDKSINWYDNTRTARDYIGYIAELNGGFARIENNTLYFKKQKANSVKTISIGDCENFNIGEYHKITRVVYELGAVKYEFGDETGNTLYLNPDNVYITEESEVQAIYNDIKDFEFYSFSTDNCPIDYDVKAGDIITFTDGTNNYPTIAQYDLEYFGTWLGGYNLDINAERQEETQIVSNKDRIRNIQITVDRQNNTLTQVVSEVDEQNTKIAQTQQSVDELNSKIQDIADITTQAETLTGSLSFTDINQSEPIEIKIHPTTTNISYLYPRDGLYPSDTLYMPDRVLRFTNTDTNEVFDYELPDDLLINTNSGNYDEFYLGYHQQVCQVTKKCKYNADGTVSDLATEQVNTYTYPIINLTDGDYTIQLLGYNNAYMNIRLMAANIYTSQFATKAELSSSISQTANEINLRVDEKLDEEDFNSANILLKINNDESSATIQADKINLNGAVTANNNFKIKTDGSMEAKNGSFTGGNIELIGGTDEAPQFIIYKDSNKSVYQRLYALYNFLVVRDDTFRYVNMSASNIDTGIQIMNTLNSMIKLTADTTGNNITLRGTGGNTYVRNSGIETPSVTQTSKEEDKKNFELLQNGLDIIKNTDIYKYNLKTQEDKSKKHIGFVIGKDYKYSHEITAENEGEEVGVDTYSMISVAYKAIQEQQELIETLQQEIKELKGEK